MQSLHQRKKHDFGNSISFFLHRTTEKMDFNKAYIILLMDKFAINSGRKFMGPKFSIAPFGSYSQRSNPAVSKAFPIEIELLPADPGALEALALASF